jgi:hypothetical protein
MLKNRLNAIQGFLLLFAGLLVIANYFENHIWIGQICDSSLSGAICDKKAAGSERSYYWDMEDCQGALREKDHEFICASGPDANKPDETMYTSFREVYFSGNDATQNREVPWSFSLLPFEIVAAFLITICVLIGQIVIRKFRKMLDNRA